MRTVRYGVSVRKDLDLIKEMRSKKYKCPRCKRLSIRRASSGIWICKKCGLKIADNAYSLSVSSIR
jgi:large subunit ribosomal protein L37Ae